MARLSRYALSPRQCECLRLTAELKGSKEIGLELGLSQKTVDSHIAAAIRVLGARDRRHAARLFVEERLRRPPEEILKQTSRLSDSPTIGSPFPLQTDCGSAAPSMLQDRSHGSTPSIPWNRSAPSLRNAMWGVKADDLTPIVRLILIGVGAAAIAIALAMTVTFADVLARLIDHA